MTQGGVSTQPSERVSTHDTNMETKDLPIPEVSDVSNGIEGSELTVNNGNTLSSSYSNGIHKSAGLTHQQPSSDRIVLTRNGIPYDVTDFASRHPGGRELLEKHNGCEIEAVMQDEAVHRHTKAAYTILEKYRLSPQNGHHKLENGNHPSKDFDGYVDWSKPLLGQVEELGERYYEWTHQQVDRPIRLFRSDLAEMMTRSHWWMVPLTWVPVVLWSLATSYRQLSACREVWPLKNVLAREYGSGSILILFALGTLFWTLLEYVIHRWLFHLRPPPSSRFLIRLHFSLHGQHHKSPMDPMRLVFPPLPAAFFALGFYVGVHFLFPTGMAHSVFAGIVSGYVAYDLTHYYIHHGGTPRLPYFQRLKKYHTLHHYEQQQLGFGISSKLWDYPFGTLINEDIQKKKVR